MSYIGNQSQTAYSAMVKQDITGNGGTSYTLSHPVSNENDILLYINNVKQEGGSGKAFTASGTTLTLSEAIANTDTCYVQYIGLAIQTVVPPDGSVSTAKIADSAVDLTSKVTGVLPVANGGTGMSTAMADQWRKTTDTNGSLEPITDLERVNTTGQGTIGTAMSVSSGIFTFPATGIYLVRATFNHALGGDSRYIFGQIQVTTNNSSYAILAEAGTSIHQSSSTNYAQSTCETFVNVTDTSNVKVKFSVAPINSSVTTRGLSSQNYTHFTFIRLGA
jgi:hypothetical protein